MPRTSLVPVFAFVVTGLLALPGHAHGQLLKKLKKAVKQEANERVDRGIREGVEIGFDKATNTVVCAVTDSDCISEAEADGKSVQVTDEEGRPISGGAAATARPGEGAWANYDFIPGDRTLFAEDFTADNVGDFPRRVELVRGNWDVVEWKGMRMLRNTGPRGAAVVIPLPETLPERFTIEFDAFFPHGNQRLDVATSRPPDGRGINGSYQGNFFEVDGRGTGVTARDRALVQSLNGIRTLNEALVPIRIMVDGEYVKMYVGEQRVANVPNAQVPRSSEIYLENTNFADQENPMVFANFRVAAGGADLYEKLEAEGRVVSRGIYFDTGSDRLRPESGPTLEEIGTALEEHPELRLTVEGHTDDVGDDDSNQNLSERRARSVVQFLVEEYGVDPDRLEAVGYGESKPVADNGTPQGRQENRRVELVKR